MCAATGPDQRARMDTAPIPHRPNASRSSPLADEPGRTIAGGALRTLIAALAQQAARDAFRANTMPGTSLESGKAAGAGIDVG